MRLPSLHALVFLQKTFCDLFLVVTYAQLSTVTNYSVEGLLGVYSMLRFNSPHASGMPLFPPQRIVQLFRAMSLPLRILLWENMH